MHSKLENGSDLYKGLKFYEFLLKVSYLSKNYFSYLAVLEAVCSAFIESSVHVLKYSIVRDN